MFLLRNRKIIYELSSIPPLIWSSNIREVVAIVIGNSKVHLQYSHREIPKSPARLGDTFCCLGDFLSFHRDNRYSQRDAQVTQRDVVTVHRAELAKQNTCIEAAIHVTETDQ